MKSKLIKIFRWVLRILSGIIILFFLLMFVGETFFPPESLNSTPLSSNSILQLVLFGILLLGLALAWKWELTGGITALGAYIGLVFMNPNTLEFSLILLYPATAMLFIVLWIINKNVIEENK